MSDNRVSILELVGIVALGYLGYTLYINHRNKTTQPSTVDTSKLSKDAQTGIAVVNAVGQAINPSPIYQTMYDSQGRMLK